MSITADSNSPGRRIATENFDNTYNFDTLLEDIKSAETIEDWSWILGDHLNWGNRKIADHVAIYNVSSAHDCTNRWTKNCQVDGDQCYAVNTERWSKYARSYRERQEYLWDSLDAETWTKAFLTVIDRKYSVDRSDVILRMNQSGDFRYQGDVTKAESIARMLEPHEIDVYTYSASDYLDWSDVESMTVNQSNTIREYGDRVYTALPPSLTPEDTDRIGDDAVLCPYELSGGEMQCGDCRLCVDPNGPDVYITLH